MNAFLEAALEYRFKYNWSIIPLSPGSKVPPKSFDVMQYRDRLATKEEIENWWKENPKYNVGVVTGKLSNLFIIDLDKYKPEYSEEAILPYIPDDLDTPIDISPRKGEHLYFQYPTTCKPTCASGILPGVDYRGEGGYCMIPPSVFEGKAGQWLFSPNGNPFSQVPALLLDYINTNNIYIYTGNDKNKHEVGQSVTINLNKGTRDQSLFHVANTMIKGGANKADVLIVLELLAKECKPPFPQNEIVTKCHSAIERAERKEMNIAKAVADFVSVTSGDFSVTDCDRFLGLVTTCDKATSRKAISRLKANNIIEKVGKKDGMYKRIETDFEFVKFEENEKIEKEYPIKLPLGLNDVAEISEANIILVAGEYNAGKTTFILNILKDNVGKLPIRYIFSEGGKSELKKRFATFNEPTSYFTKGDTEFIKRSGDFHSVIRPDALNIIDYFEFTESEYNRGAEYLRQINDKLTTGIAVIAIQKKQGTALPRAGDLVMEKPRLAISFTKLINNHEYPEGICEILKCKIPKSSKADGKKFIYEIRSKGSRFQMLKDWGFWKLSDSLGVGNRIKEKT